MAPESKTPSTTSNITASTVNETPSQSSRNIISLESKTSTISHVRVYSDSAEITRLFKCNVRTGQNQVNILGLPKVLDPDSVRTDYEARIEGITVHGVTVSVIVFTPRPASDELKDKKRKAERACDRAKKSLPTLETYLGLLKITPIDTQTLLDAVKSYETAAAEQEDDVMRLEKELAKINDEISGGKATRQVNSDLNLKAVIGISNSTSVDQEIEIKLIYAVHNAAWKAEYDIHVNNIKPKESEGLESLSVALTYKGSITQSTAEDWDDIRSLTLETAIPTSRLGVPTLTPLNIPIHRQPQNVKKSTAMTSASSKASRVQVSWPGRRIFKDESSSKSKEQRDHLDVQSCIPLETKSISIQSGEMAHIVNIPLESNELETTNSYVCVPRKDTKTYLYAKIKNVSKYAFLSGKANIYVNDKFVSKSDVPFVSPGGTFDCLYGIESSIRVIYHPSYRKIFKSGFFTKTTNYVYSQTITISNTKKEPIRGTLKIIDQAPIFQSDPDFTVRMISPALGTPGEGFGGGMLPDTNGNGRTGPSAGETVALPKKSSMDPKKLSVDVISGIIAQWHGAEEAQVTGDVGSLGSDGKFDWVCKDIKAEEKIELLLRWKVTVPASVKTDVADSMTEPMAKIR